MKATDLIRALAAQVAKNGDLDVFLPTTEADQFRMVFDTGVGTAAMQKMHGNRLQWLSAAKAERLGYEPASAVVGIVIR